MAEARVCLIPECGKPAKTKGLCQAHYLRKLRHGSPTGGATSKREPLAFYRDVVLKYEGDECLIWPYAKTHAGYAQLYRCGKVGYVSRFVCADIYGPPPSNRHHAAHSCGNGHSACVAKGHLFWKTPADNIADKIDHGTDQRGARNHQSKLTENDVREIRSLRGAMTQKDIAAKFGITSSNVCLIQRRKNWDWM